MVGYEVVIYTGEEELVEERPPVEDFDVEACAA